MAPRPLAYDGFMRKRWLVLLVLSLLIGRAWGLHLPLIMGQEAPCHGQAASALHASAAPAHAAHLQADSSAPAQLHAQDDGVATASVSSAEAPTSSSSAPTDGVQGDGHVCCLVLLGVEDWLWPASFVFTPEQPEPSWASTSLALDLRPPIQGL